MKNQRFNRWLESTGLTRMELAQVLGMKYASLSGLIGGFNVCEKSRKRLTDYAGKKPGYFWRKK